MPPPRVPVYRSASAMSAASSRGSVETSLMWASASPTALTSADDDERPEATGRFDSTTPSKPLHMAKRRASSFAEAFA